MGGAGVKIGKACIELNAQEHGIQTDGFFRDEEASRATDANHSVLFREDSMGLWTPRSIFLDRESDQINELLSSDIGQMVEPG